MNRNISLIQLIPILFLTILGFYSKLYSQKVIVSDEKLISEGIDHPLNEPHLIIDPNNSEHLLVAAILTKDWKEGKPPDSYILLFQSWDGGETWEKTHFDNGITLGADPWLAMNQEGTVILTALNKLENKPYVHLTAFVSNDSGKNWNKEFLNLGYAHDRQSIVVDPKTQNFIIASAKYNINEDNKKLGGIMITRLAKDGTFTEANWHPFSNLDKNNGTPFITPNGELLVPFVDYMVNGRMLDTRRNWIIKSNDLGRSFQAPILIDEGGTFPNVILDTSHFENVKIHYLKPKGSFREYKGYQLRSSSDYGYSWTKEIDIDQSEIVEPYIRGGQMAINKDGLLGIFWFERKERGGSQHDLFFSYSKDKMQFNEPIKISSKPSTPNPNKNGMVDKRWPVGGDYFGLVTTDEGSFRIVWVDYRNGKPQLFQGLVSIND